MSLSFEKRKKRILEALRRDGRVEVPVLADQLQVSAETIRRDLERLDREGNLKKVHGGAVKLESDSQELPYEIKTRLNAEEKAAIGKQAAALINDGDTVMLGNGTTTIEIIRNLGESRDVTIITHSTPTLLLALESFPGRIIFIGGEVNKRQKSVEGPLADLVLNQLRVNKAFISAGGVSLVDGITDYELSEAKISRMMMDRADEAFILADSSKLGRTTFANVCPLDDVYMFITDKHCSPEWKQYLSDRDIRVFIAEAE
ncbi:DeoR/GlpR family transcriptional regulator of sugar metabolism [Paenibacillus endophyticus]|uniref:DeoR/GlpR family transcriptional regulator of sugar metabolism n=1 Tax=Paenibacillus endophyticus TaxID=1294268 RepID=A0A7W5CDX8_9BACL|nr:DeoR/GlpR family DNA-binding transcription regulator [Paenibacillus endophyticus]MBB3155911.1 DeoR/GlpR family transcriptional regulator of sugar metabolism [Paenibacillus endophyticus]